MPRLFGLNIVATLVAGFALWMLGYLWYGVIFTESWTALQNFTPEVLLRSARGFRAQFG